MLRWLLRSLFFLVIASLSAITVHTAIWAGPRFVDRVHHGSIKPACAQVRVGMTVAEVQQLLHSSSLYSAAINGTQMQFLARGVCEVQLDSAAQKVLSSQFREETEMGEE